jgi:hypothetical protein
LKSGHIVIRRNRGADAGLDWAEDDQTGVDNGAGSGRREGRPHEDMSDADRSEDPRTLGRHSQQSRLDLRLHDSCHSGHEHTNIPSGSWMPMRWWQKETVFQMSQRHWPKHCTSQRQVA